MKKIKVISPIRLRVSSDAPVRAFAPGVHTVSEEELQHWFLQACIKEGRAVLMAEPEQGAADKAPPAPLTEAALKKKTNAELEKLLQEICPDGEVLSGMTKAELIAAILDTPQEDAQGENE